MVVDISISAASTKTGSSNGDCLSKPSSMSSVVSMYSSGVGGASSLLTGVFTGGGGGR